MSMAAFSNGANHSSYTASKHAARVVTEALEAEMAGRGIGVSGLYPGAVMTDIVHSQRNRQARFGDPMNFDFGAQLAGRSSGARDLAVGVMEPIEVGRLVRQAVIDDEPWIFTHPEWMGSGRWDEIATAAQAAVERKRTVDG
jgi:NAD(P)-dependent dehydrogenase (short-subunit alcohol dehydrogenase family)